MSCLKCPYMTLLPKLFRLRSLWALKVQSLTYKNWIQRLCVCVCVSLNADCRSLCLEGTNKKVLFGQFRVTKRWALLHKWDPNVYCFVHLRQHCFWPRSHRTRRCSQMLLAEKRNTLLTMGVFTQQQTTKDLCANLLANVLTGPVWTFKRQMKI